MSLTPRPSPAHRQTVLLDLIEQGGFSEEQQEAMRATLASQFAED